MAFAGEFLSLAVSLAQEISIVLGVGALTITLAGHLLSLHAHKNETVYGFVRVARQIRALALAAIIVSGGVAILIHLQTKTPEVFLAPAFLFKWALIGLLTAFYFVELKVEGVWRDAVEGFEGANWYALFIVHAMAPAIGWMLLLSIYAGWLATFGIIWAVFVWIMRRHSALPPKSDLAPNPFPAPGPTPITASKLSVAPPVAAAPIPSAVPTPAPVPTPKAPAPQSKIEVHPNHSMLPMIAELDLPAPKAAAAATQPPPVAPAPVPPPAPVREPAPVQVVPESSKPAVAMPNLEETGLPALHVMPKRPEDIDASKRGPVVKMSDSEQ